jgi:hypothetical protein
MVHRSTSILNVTPEGGGGLVGIMYIRYTTVIRFVDIVEVYFIVVRVCWQRK